MRGARALKNGVIEPIWLSVAMERARAYPESKRERIGELVVGARARLDAATRLRDDRTLQAALALEREGLVLTSEARSLAGLGAPELGGLMAEIETNAVLAASVDVQRRREAEAKKRLRELVDGVEVRSVADLRWARSFRIALVAFAIVAVVLGWRRASAHYANVARYKEVRASSVAGGAQTAAVTDGSSARSSTFATRIGDSQWVEVDLLDRFRLARVVIHSALETTSPEMLPLIVEGAIEPERYSELGRRDAPVAAREPWRVELGGRELRYVRLRHPGRGVIFVSEIEAIRGR